MSADAGGELIVGSFVVEGEQELSGRPAGFGKDEDVDVVFVSDITDVAGEIAAVEIPEEEAGHRNSGQWSVSHGQGIGNRVSFGLGNEGRSVWLPRDQGLGVRG